MLNSGELKLLRNHDGIRKLEEKCLYTNIMENIHYDANMSQVVQAINTAIKFSTGQLQKPKLVSNYEFQNLFFRNNTIYARKGSSYIEAIIQIDSITKLINNELNE